MTTEQIIINAILIALSTTLATLLGRWLDKRQIQTGINKSESDMAINLQQIADKAVEEQNKLRKEIERIHAEKQADYEIIIVFTFSPVPSIKQVRVRAVDPATQSPVMS